MRLTLILVGLLAYAADPVSKSKEFPLDETVALRMENAGLRVNLIKTQAEEAMTKLQAQQEKERLAICAKVKIDAARCKIDLDNRKIVEIELPKEAPPAK